MSEFVFASPEILWFIAGLLFFLLELILPGFVIFFFGVGAWLTALICLVANPGINLQVFLFAITSVIALLSLRKVLTNKFFKAKENSDVDIDDDFTGKKAVALSSFEPEGTGKVEFHGSTWQATSKSKIEAGQEVIIVGKETITLIVEPK